jgi:hypothetical protein
MRRITTSVHLVSSFGVKDVSSFGVSMAIDSLITDVTVVDDDHDHAL